MLELMIAFCEHEGIDYEEMDTLVILRMTGWKEFQGVKIRGQLFHNIYDLVKFVEENGLRRI